MNAITERTVHQGRNVKRFREMLGIKQDALADMLGEDWNQKKVSLLEVKESIDQKTLEIVAEALRVPVRAIEEFDEEKAINIISSNSFENCDQRQSVFYNSTFNPIDKWLEALEKNERLYEELLKSEREKVAMLERIIATN